MAIHKNDVESLDTPLVIARLCEEIESDVKILPSVIETTLNELRALDV